MMRLFLYLLLTSTVTMGFSTSQVRANSSVDKTSILATDNIRSLARSVTIAVENSQGNGSGVLIAKSNNSYYVLTSAHVLSLGSDNQIITPDRKSHVAKVIARKFSDLDLAVLEFKSSSSYQIATLAGYQTSSSGLIDFGGVYVSGWIASNGSSPHQFAFSCGNKFQGDVAALALIRKNLGNDGYQLAYTNETQEGLSGGPVFDMTGRVIGIHGQAEGSDLSRLSSIKLGFSLGIPTYLFLPVLEKSSLSSHLKIDRNLSEGKFSQSNACGVVEPVLPSSDADGLEWGDYANSMLRLFKLDDALSAYDKAVERRSESYEFWQGRGLTLQFLNRSNNAIKSFDQALKLLPTSYINNLEGAEDKASANLSRSILLSYKGRLLSQTQKYQDALLNYEEALRSQPSSSQMWFLKAGSLSDLGRHVEAIEAYSEAIQRESKSIFLTSRSASYIQNFQYDLAILDLTKAIKIDPKNVYAYASRGALRKKIGDKAGSINDYGSINLLTYQSSAMSNFNSAELLIIQAETAVGIPIENQTIPPVSHGKSENNSGTMDSMMRAFQGIFQGAIQNPEVLGDAEKYSSFIISNLTPFYKSEGFENYLQAYSTLAYGIRNPLDSGKLEQVLSKLNKAIELGQGNSKIYGAYAMRSAFYEVQGNDVAARNDFDDALKTTESLSSIYQERGIARLGIGNKKAALIDFQQAARIAKNEGKDEEYRQIMTILDALQP